MTEKASSRAPSSPKSPDTDRPPPGDITATAPRADDRRTIIPAALPPPPPLDWGDPAAVQRWICDVRIQSLDVIAAGLDATARRRRRVLSRAEARRQIRAADEALAALFATAQGAAP